MSTFVAPKMFTFLFPKYSNKIKTHHINTYTYYSFIYFTNSNCSSISLYKCYTNGVNTRGMFVVIDIIQPYTGPLLVFFILAKNLCLNAFQQVAWNAISNLTIQRHHLTSNAQRTVLTHTQTITIAIIILYIINMFSLRVVYLPASSESLSIIVLCSKRFFYFFRIFLFCSQSTAESMHISTINRHRFI